MKRETVETNNVRAIKNAVRDAVNNRDFLAVIAEVGAGKTHIFNTLNDFWEESRHKFAVVKIKSMNSLRSSRVSAIMDLMIAEISPEAKIPQVIEKRYKVLDSVLRSTKKKVILIIDEAQDLTLSTFLDLKKIHEINGAGDRLFSIILFGKTHRKWSLLSEETPELGFRVKSIKLKDLTAEEIVQIAERSFGLRFSSLKTKERFAATVKYKTPLGVEFAAMVLKLDAGIGNNEQLTVGDEEIKKLPTLTLRLQLKQAGITQTAYVAVAKKALPHRHINKQRVNEHLNGKLNNPDLADELNAVAATMIKNRFSEREKIS